MIYLVILVIILLSNAVTDKDVYFSRFFFSYNIILLYYNLSRWGIPTWDSD